MTVNIKLIQNNKIEMYKKLVLRYFRKKQGEVDSGLIYVFGKTIRLLDTLPDIDNMLQLYNEAVRQLHKNNLPKRGMFIGILKQCLVFDIDDDKDINNKYGYGIFLIKPDQIFYNQFIIDTEKDPMRIEKIQEKTWEVFQLNKYNGKGKYFDDDMSNL